VLTPARGSGRIIADSRRRSRGRGTPSEGSLAIRRSRTAARKTERTLLKCVRMAPGASLDVVIAFTHSSILARWIFRNGVSVKGADLAARSIALDRSRLPHLPLGPPVVELTERDGSDREVDVVAARDRVELVGLPPRACDLSRKVFERCLPPGR
jgi:hypothetical protein